jgi:hypothetical protein
MQGPIGPQGLVGPQGPPGGTVAATTTTMGGVIVGSGLAVAPDGTLSATGGGGGQQTPWLSNVDAAGFELINVSRVLGNGSMYIQAANNYVNCLYLSLNAGVADTRCYGVFSHFLTAVNVANILLSDSGLAVGYTVDGTPSPGGGRLTVAEYIVASGIPQYADLATAQAALGAGSKILWCDPSNAVYVA